MIEQNRVSEKIIPFRGQQRSAIPERRVDLITDYPGPTGEERIAAIKKNKQAYDAHQQKLNKERQRFLIKRSVSEQKTADEEVLPHECVIIDFKEARIRADQRKRNSRLR